MNLQALLSIPSIVTVAVALIACDRAPLEPATRSVVPTTPVAQTVPVEQPIPADSAPPTVSCDVLRSRILERVFDARGSVSRDEQDELVRLVRTSEKQADDATGEMCSATIVRELSKSPACGSAAELVTSALALDGSLPQTIIEQALKLPGPCVMAIVAGAANAPTADPRVVRTIEKWVIRQTDPMHRSAGFTVLGALARTARDSGDSTTADSIDAALLRELRLPAAFRAERVQRIEAAGNAGCGPCTGVLRGYLRDRESEVRRAAVGAYRFVASDDAARAMCGVADSDLDANVREQAAWALGWKREGASLRVHCLVRAAARDTSARVRMQAASSLAAMMREVPLARSAMLQLTASEYGDGDVRALALRMSATFPPLPEDGQVQSLPVQ